MNTVASLWEEYCNTSVVLYVLNFLGAFGLFWLYREGKLQLYIVGIRNTYYRFAGRAREIVTYLVR